MAIIGAVAVWNAGRADRLPSTPAMRVTVPLPPATTIALSRGPAVALSPDGRTLVFSATSASRAQLYMRPIDSRDATPIPGTDGATDPFFSPSGQWLGFFADGKLKKIAIAGGPPITLADAPNARGDAWGPDDTVYFTPRNNTGIWSVPAGGGTPRQVTTPGLGELSHRWPQILPGGKAMLFTIWNDNGFEGGRVAVQRLSEAGQHRVLVQGGGYPRYVGPDSSGRGYLIFAQAAGLVAAPFDLERLEIVGPTASVLDDVITNLSGGAHMGVSSNGLLAYLPGTLGEAERTLAWVDRDGKAQPAARIRGMSLTFSLSPDGRRVVRQNNQSASRDLWIEDLERGTSTRFTFAGTNFDGVWSRDGKWIAYSSGLPNYNLFVKPADGSGADRRLTTSANSQRPAAWTPDGLTMVFVENDPVRGADIWTLPLDRESRVAGSAKPFLQTPFIESNPALSSDGRWLAYQSNESGRFEIYVMPFPEGGRKLQISTDGGLAPKWARKGHDLFYYQNTRPAQFMAATIRPGPELNADRPRKLFEGRFETQFDIAPDDRRFLMIQGLTLETSATQVNVVVNWFEELTRLVPAER